MEEGKVIRLEKDGEDKHLTGGLKLLEQGDYLSAIKEFLCVLNTRDNLKLTLAAEHLSLAYYRAGLFDLSLFFAFLDMESLGYGGPVFFPVANVYLKRDDYKRALFYLKKTRLKLGLVGNEIIDTFYNSIMESRKGLKILNNNNEGIEKLRLAEDLMSSARFEDAKKIYDSLDNFQDDEIRQGGVLCNIFLNKLDEAENIISINGKGNVDDLCNLLLIYYLKNDTKNYELIREKLTHLKNISKKERFTIGLSLARTGKPNDALSHMSVYKDDFSNLELSFFYALTCINAGKFKAARNKLVELYNIDYFNRFIYKYYIDICDEKRADNLSYVFSVQAKDLPYINDRIKKLSIMESNKLEKEFTRNLDFFYFLLKLKRRRDVENLILRVVRIENIDIYLFTRYILLNSSFSDKFKIKVLKEIFLHKIDIHLNIGILYNDYFYNFQVPDLEFYSKFIKDIRQIVFRSVLYLLDNIEPSLIDLEKEVSTLTWIIRGKWAAPISIRKVNDEEKQMENEFFERQEVVISYIVYKVVEKRKNAPQLRDVLTHFRVSQKEFYEFVNKYELQVL